MTIKALLFDMNGLFRTFHGDGARTAELILHAPAGTIDAYAYDHPDYTLAKVGVLTNAQWVDSVRARLTDTYGLDPANRAIEAWASDRGSPNTHMINILGRLRTQYTVGVLSNFTNALHTDLTLHGITFDHAFSSHDLGIQKPSPPAYLEAAHRMGYAPDTIAYWDDREDFVQGARHAGLHAHLFTGADALLEDLAHLGITV